MLDDLIKDNLEGILESIALVEARFEKVDTADRNTALQKDSLNRGLTVNISSVKCTFIGFFIFFFIFWTQAIKQSWASEESRFGRAQELVDNVASKHPDLVRLTIHAVPAGEECSRIVACNIKKKIGKPSDPEDLEAMKTGKTVTLKEGDNLDVTAPILDKAGKPVAATGITLRFKKGETENEVIEKAKSIAEELTIAIQNADKPLW